MNRYLKNSKFKHLATAATRSVEGNVTCIPVYATCRHVGGRAPACATLQEDQKEAHDRIADARRNAALSTLSQPGELEKEFEKFNRGVAAKVC